MISGMLICIMMTVIEPEALEVSDIKILVPGSFHGEYVNAESGEIWWGLFPDKTENTCTFRPTEILVEPFKDTIMEDKEGQMTGRKISVKNESTPVLLIQGMKHPEAGSVSTSFVGSKVIYPGQVEYNHLEDGSHVRSVTVCAFGNVPLSQTRDYPKNIYDYTLCLYVSTSEEKIFQEIFSEDKIYLDGYPSLLWAGDIDRDLKMDFLFNLTNCYVVSQWTLFLSSAAEDGACVGKVAEFYYPWD